MVGSGTLSDFSWFREQIRAANNGRAPGSSDPFAGGGAIPLEAMRLGCEVVANDLDPDCLVCPEMHTGIPQRLANQTLPLPAHAMGDAAFITAFLKARGLKGMRLDEDVATMVATGRGEPAQQDFLEDRPWERADLGWQSGRGEGGFWRRPGGNSPRATRPTQSGKRSFPIGVRREGTTAIAGGFGCADCRGCTQCRYCADGAARSPQSTLGC